MKEMRNYIIGILLFASSIGFAQQTPQTSFFTQNRATWNAAFTGMNEQISVNTFVRQQWLGFGLDAPRTVSLDFQYPFVDLNMAAGAAIHYDQTGPVSKRGVNLNYAYQIKDLGLNDGQLNFGIMAGGHQYVFNPSNQVVNNDGDPLLETGNQTAFYPSIGGGMFYLSSTETYRNNTNFYAGLSFQQAYETNVLVGQYNQKRISHTIFDLGSRIYGYNYMIEPSISVNLTTPEIIDVLLGVTFEMRDKFWAGAGYSSIQELALQGGYIIEDVGGRDTRLKLGVLGNIGLGEKLEDFGPGAELFIRYEFDMD